MEELKNVLLEGGMEGPFCYYRTLTSDISYNDAQGGNQSRGLDVPHFLTTLRRHQERKPSSIPSDILRRRKARSHSEGAIAGPGDGGGL